MPKNKSKKLKTEKSFSGAQLYMSEKAKKAHRNRPPGGTDLENLIDDSITSRMLEGKMTPTESGTLGAKTYSDMSSRAYNNDDNDTQKFMGGGMVKQGYMDGGEVRAGDVRDNSKRGKTY